MLAQSMRPKFKADTYYIPTPDGVYLRGNNSRLSLKGKSLYPLLEYLVPNLNGNITLEELTGGLDVDRKRMVTNLIEKLFTHQFLKDTSQDQLHELQPLELETYASDIAFIDSLQTSATYRFDGFRHKRLLLIGSGPSCATLVQASLQCGVKKIDAIITPGNEADTDFRQQVLDLFATSTSEVDAHLIDTPNWSDEAELQNTIQAYDAILHIADQSGLARAQRLNKLCIEQRKMFIQAIIVDDHAWVGPLVCPETDSCWECAWRRLQANLPENSDQFTRYEFLDKPLTSRACSLATPEATIIANRLLFTLLQYVTQASSTNLAEKSLSALDLETFLSENHIFLAHPHCLAHQHPAAPTASEFLAQIQCLRDQSPLDPNSFLENLDVCIDEKLGLFTAIDNGDFVQAPLTVYRVNLSNPMLRERQPERLNVVAASINTKEAIMRTAQKACECYAANLVNQRQLLSTEAAQACACPVIASTQLMGTHALPSEDEMWTWALDLQTQQASLVPATRVFSSLCQPEQGIASGKTWDEAICQALLDWCNYLTVAQLQDSRQAYSQVDLNQMPMTPEGIHLYRLLKAAVGQITVYDVTGPLHVPTFAICLDGKVVAYSTHCDGAQALRLGFEQALQQYQSAQFQQPDYAVAPVIDCPLSLRGDQLSVPCYTLPETWPARLEWLLQQLQATGLHAFAIPLNHDPALEQVLPFIVHVLVGRRELKKGE